MSQIDGSEYRALVFNAARDNNLARLKIFLEVPRTPEWLHSCINCDKNDKIPFVIAARNGHLEIIKYLISKTADPTIRGTVSFDGETILSSPAIWAASAAGHMNVVKYLVEDVGVDLNQTTSTNSTPLRGACYDGHMEIVEFLVNHGANLEIGNRHGHTPLMIACYRGKLEVAKLLISRGADVRKSTSKGNTALHDAAEGNQPAICQLLLDSGAKLQDDENGLCPLMSAALLGNELVFPILLSACTCGIRKRKAMKLLGCTRCDKKMDISSTLDAWIQAVSQFPLSAEELKQAELEESEYMVPEVYGDIKEVVSERDVKSLIGQPELIHMQSLLIRERILGGRNTDVHYYLRFRGAVYCDLGRPQRCFQLWMHTLKIQQQNLPPLSMATMTTFNACYDTFSMPSRMHGEDVDHLLFPLRISQVLEIYKCVCFELQKLVDWGDRSLYDDCCGDDHVHDPENDKQKLILIGLQLLLLMYRLSLPSFNHDDSLEIDINDVDTLNAINSNKNGLDAYEMEIEQATVDLVESCSKIGALPLHIALKEYDEQKNEIPFFPAPFVVQSLLRAGASVVTRDRDGNIPLHILLLNALPRPSIVKMLLDYGSPLLAASYDDVTCWDLIELSRVSDVQLGKYLRLIDVASRAVRRHNLPFSGIIPEDCLPYVNLH